MRNRMIIWILLGGGALVLFLVTVAALIVTIGSSDGGSDFAFGDRIQVVNIDGELTDSRFLMDQLTRYEDSESVRGILLNIDSPWGGVRLLKNSTPRFGAFAKTKEKWSLPICPRLELQVPLHRLRC